MSQRWDIAGKTFLITGAASGIGALYAEAFLKAGAKNVAILDIAEEVGNSTADRLNKISSGKVIFVKCDVSKEEDVTDAFNKVVDEFKKVDAIINNAGIMVDTPAIWRTACLVNWQGVVSFTLKGIKHMRKDEGGSGGTIINIASTAAISKARPLPIYCGSKAAVLHFSQSIAVEPFFEQTGVRVMTLCPGATDTALLQNLRKRPYDDTLANELTDLCEAAQLQKPESTAAVCVTMFQEGANGTVWLSIYDKPAQNITPVIDAAYAEFEKLMIP